MSNIDLAHKKLWILDMDGTVYLGDQLDLASRQESDHIREVVAEVVPTYHYDKKPEEAKV